MFSTTIVVTTVTVIVTNNYTGNYSLVTTGTIADCLQYRYGGTIVDCLLTQAQWYYSRLFTYIGT